MSCSSGHCSLPLVDIRTVPSSKLSHPNIYFRRHSHWWQARYDSIKEEGCEDEAPIDTWAASFSPFAFSHHPYQTRHFIRALHEPDEEQVLVQLYEWMDESENRCHPIVYKHYSTHSVCENVEFEITLYHMLYTSTIPPLHYHLIHPRHHIIPLLGWDRDSRDDTYHIAFPYIAPRHTSPILSMDDVSLYMYQLMITLSYLHQHDIIHRNIKRANIICDSYNHMYLIDFEHSIIYQPHMKWELIGNPHYRAPEVATTWIDPKSRVERKITARRCGRSMSRTPYHGDGVGMKDESHTSVRKDGSSDVVKEEDDITYVSSHTPSHCDVDGIFSTSCSSTDTSTPCTSYPPSSSHHVTPPRTPPMSPCSLISSDCDCHDISDDSDDEIEYETLRMGSFTHAIDIFSAGIVCAELLLTNGNENYHILPPPCHETSRSYTSSRVAEDHIWLQQRMTKYSSVDVFQPYMTSQNHDRLTHEWADLLIHMLDISPTTRYSAEQVLSHPAMARGRTLYQQQQQRYLEEIHTMMKQQQKQHDDATSPVSPLIGKRDGDEVPCVNVKRRRVDVSLVA